MFPEIVLKYLLFQSGDDNFPVDEQGKCLLDTVDFCDTWEVSTFPNDIKASRGRENQLTFPLAVEAHFTHKYLLEWKGWNAFLKM